MVRVGGVDLSEDITTRSKFSSLFTLYMYSVCILKSALISMFWHFEGLSVVSVLGLFEHYTNNFL